MVFEYLDVVVVVLFDVWLVVFEVCWYVVVEGVGWFDGVVVYVDEDYVFEFYCCCFLWLVVVFVVYIFVGLIKGKC